MRGACASAVTTTREATFSFEVPYLSVERPEPPVETIPPTDGLEAGSGPKSSPCGASCAASSSFLTPGCTTACIAQHSIA